VRLRRAIRGTGERAEIAARKAGTARACAERSEDPAVGFCHRARPAAGNVAILGTDGVDE